MEKQQYLEVWTVLMFFEILHPLYFYLCYWFFNDRSVEIELMWINPLTRAPSLIKSPSWVHVSDTLSLIRVVPWQRYKTPWPQSFNPWPQLLVANTPQSGGFTFKGVDGFKKRWLGSVSWTFVLTHTCASLCLNPSLLGEQSGTLVFTNF